MLYCPKCRRAYEEGKRRFCDYDGVRLLPAPAKQNSFQQSGGVFASLFSKISELRETEETALELPVPAPSKETEKTNEKLGEVKETGADFQNAAPLNLNTESLTAPKSSKEAEAGLALEPEKSPAEAEPESPKPSHRVVRPSEIPSGTASVGDRKINPAGRTALSWENQEALVGQTIKGRYQISEKLEEDAESIVYLASDKIVEGRRAIIRVFMETDADDFDFAEKRVSLAHLKHPNIAAVIDSGELPEGKGFIVSEFVAGKSLKELLRETGQFEALRTARIIRQISYALSEAHQHGVLHGSLAPENIVLNVTEAGNEQVKLLNFGLSSGDWTEENLAYKAPEEIEEGISSFASDIYALGVIAYQMLTARVPFNAATEKKLLNEQKSALSVQASSFRSDLSPAVDKILQKALSFNPAERYPKARDFGEAFFNAAASSSAAEDEKTAELSGKTGARESEGAAAELRPEPAAEDFLPSADIHITSSVPPEEDLKSAAAPQMPGAKRQRDWAESPEAAPSGIRRLLILFGLIVLAVLFGLTLWFLNR